MQINPTVNGDTPQVSTSISMPDMPPPPLFHRPSRIKRFFKFIFSISLKIVIIIMATSAGEFLMDNYFPKEVNCPSLRCPTVYCAGQKPVGLFEALDN